MVLFASVIYHLSQSIPQDKRQLLRHVLDSNGAQYTGSVKDATIVITNSHRFEGWQDVKEGAFAVTDKWAERSLVLGKLQLPQHYSPDPTMIFSGVIACATELPPQDLEVLSAGVTALGGQWRTGLTKEVTHLFAINTTSAKYSTAFHYQEETGVKVVLPHWFDDAVRLGMGCLSTKSYEWPDPPLLRNQGLFDDEVAGKTKGKGKKVVDVEQDAIKRNLYATATQFTITGSSSSVDMPEDEVETPVITNTWESRRILLGRSLRLFGRRREAVEMGIKRAGGVIIRWDGDEDEEEDSDDVAFKRRVSERQRHEADASVGCDIYITRWRSGRAYVRSFRSNKTIGTLAWLYHVQSTGIFTRPLDQLLHFPIPKRPIEGFTGHEITVTNYTGEAREYLKKLIITMGASFTPSMSGQNTVLIAANMGGVKADRAKSWSIPVVNHTWLEDCFVQWRNLTVGHDKYLAFPNGVEFSQMLGERGVGVGKMLDEEVEGMDDDDESESDEGVRSTLTPQPVLPNGRAANADEDQDTMDPPPGTEGSMEEVAGLIDSDGDAVMNVAGDDEVGGGLSDSPAEANSFSDEDSPDMHPSAANIHSSRSKDNPKPKPTAKLISTSVSPSRARPGKTVSSKSRRTVLSKSEGEKDRGRRRSRLLKDSDTEDEDEGQDSTTVQAIPTRSNPTIRKKIVFSDESSEDDVINLLKSKTLGRRKKQIPEEEEEEEEAGEESEGVKEVSPPKKGEKKGDGGVGKLKMVRGDARTRVKKAQARQVDSDEEGGVESDEPVISPAKGKGKATSTAGVTSKATSSKATPKRAVVFTEDDMGDTPIAPPKKKSTTRLEEDSLSNAVALHPKPRPKGVKKKTSNIGTAVSDVETVSHPPKRVVTVLMPSLELSGKGKKSAQNGTSKPSRAKDKAVDEEDEDDEELPEVPEQSPRTRSVKKTESFRIAAGERGHSSPIKPSASKTSKTKAAVTKNAVASGSVHISSRPTTKKTVALPSVSSPDDTSDHAPSVASAPLPRRSAAAKATARLRDEVMPDLVNFEQQMRKSRRSGGDVSGFVVKGDTPVESGAKRKKSSKTKTKLVEQEEVEEVDSAEDEGGDKKRRKVEVKIGKSVQAGKNGKAKDASMDDNDAPTSVAKGGKKSSKRDKVQVESENDDLVVVPTSKGPAKKKSKNDLQQSVLNGSASPIRMMTTQVTLSDEVSKNLAKLGVTVTTRTSECTHLITNHLVRTEKFLCALAVAPYILSAEWATKSSQAKKLLPEEDYILYDKEGEEKYGVSLAKSLRRAKQNGRKLLEKKTFYVTPRVPVDVKLLKNVVAACGGQVSTQTPTARILNISPDRHVISCPEDISIWRPLLNNGHAIYTQELLLAGTLNQELDWDNDSFKVEGST